MLRRETIVTFLDAMGWTDDVPRLPDEPVEELLALFSLAPAGKGILLGAAPVQDPWPGIMLGRGSEFWEEELARQVAGLMAVGATTAEETFFVESIADAHGAHRVYASTPGDGLYILCRDIDPFVELMSARWASEELGACATPDLARLTWDGAEDGDGYAWMSRDTYRIADELRGLARAWQGAAEGSWRATSRAGSVRPAAADRAWILTTVETFVAQGELLLPARTDTEALPAPVERLVAEMDALCRATRDGVVPPSLRDLAAGTATPGYAPRQPSVRRAEQEAAARWIAAFARTRS